MFDPVYVSFTLLLNHSLKRFSGLFSLLRINFSSLAFVVSVGVCTAIVFSEATSCIPAIATDHVVFLGQDALSASANPSPLSIPWGIEKYVAKLAEGLE